MVFRARLVHVDATVRVVLVRAYEGERCLGSALGEASTAEEAEDRASERLRQRLRRAVPEASPATTPSAKRVDRSRPSPSLGTVRAPEPGLPRLPEEKPPGEGLPEEKLSAESLPAERLPEKSAGPPEPAGPSDDPEDWSADLTRLDALLGSLGWGREQERVYLQRLFGQPSRSRLTRYADLMVLRRALEAIPPGSPPDTAPLPILRRDLLTQCDDLLGQLAWTTDRAREWLEAHFAVSSRQRLSDDQLLAFNLLLEGELLGQAEIGGAGRCLELPPIAPEPSLS